MKYSMEGSVMPLLHIVLDENETVISERGAMVWMDENIHMHTSSHGGMGGGVHRMLMGESFFVNKFTAKNGPGSVSFGLSVPGKIVDFKMTMGMVLMIRMKILSVLEIPISLEAASREKNIDINGERTRLGQVKTKVKAKKDQKVVVNNFLILIGGFHEEID